MKNRIILLTILLLGIGLPTRAAEISETLTGQGKLVTIKTDNGYYMCAIEEGGKFKLGQTTAAPTAATLPAYQWEIGGDATGGYTFRSIAYMTYSGGFSNSTTAYTQPHYIANPAPLGTGTQEVVLSTQSSRYYYTSTRQLQLADNTGLYLAMYSQNYHTFRLHNSADYTGSRISMAPMKDAPAPRPDADAVTGEDGTIWYLTPAHYITNTSGNYSFVPGNKAWMMTIEVDNDASSATFNQYGSAILASGIDPLNTYYWNEFQVYQKAAGQINFKSNKANGADHIIAEGASVAGKDYSVTVRYNGERSYVITTAIEGHEYNNVWTAVRDQNDIHTLSCALPTGLNISSLRISIAEESNLLEGTDYAIRHIATGHFISGTGPAENTASAADAAKLRIEFTGNDNLTYAEQDGGLHHSFYLIKGGQYIGVDGTLVSSRAEAQPFIYTTNRHLAPIAAKDRLGSEWTIGSEGTWAFDFFAHFLVEANRGGLRYQQGGEQQTATNGQYVWLPTTVDPARMSNTSLPGYSAEISKLDVSINVKYTALTSTFYTFTSTEGRSELCYWDAQRQKLISYSTVNSESGNIVEWGERGDCSKMRIGEPKQIPVKMSLVDGRYYGSICCPNALTLPEGVSAYKLTGTTADHLYVLTRISDDLLPAGTPALLVSDEGLESDPSGLWTIDAANTTPAAGQNLFEGSYERTANPGAGQQALSTVYMLGNKADGIGFYPYSGAMIPAFKAYHELPQTESTGAPIRFGFEVSDEATALPDQPLAERPESDACYDVLGRPVSEPQPGQIYICGGKKIILY